MNIISLIKCKYVDLSILFKNSNYFIIPANPAKGILYITENSPHFISGQIRVRGKNHGRYPFCYLEMIDNLFGKEENTIEVCSGSVKGNCFTVDINPDTEPNLVADGQKLDDIPDGKFNRWRCDPPYNAKTAKEMYGTDLPSTIDLLKVGARVCKVGSLMFLLLGPQNYQRHPSGIERIGYVNITVVPSNEIRCLNIFHKYAE
jgi:hypothetical protein